MNSILGMPVQESLHAVKVTTTVNRPHKKRHNQSDAYHRRISKKWKKRFGVTKTETPCIFMMDLRAVGLGTGKALLVHPALMPGIRAGFSAETVFAQQPLYI